MRRINRGCAAAGSGHFAEGDLVAEVLELLHEVVLVAGGVTASGEVVATEVVVVAVVGEQVPGDDQDGVADGDGCSFLAEAFGEAPELCGEVGVATSGGGPSALG